jgi:site-specific recombinase XerD
VPVIQIPFAKKPKKLPVVLGPEETKRLLECARPLKPRVLLTTIYATGLRLEEATHLKMQDIDSVRMLLRVAHGKGAKERLVPLSPRLLEELRGYWKVVRPERWLFPGGDPEKPLSDTTVQKSCKRAARDAGITKHVSPHVLRHSHATALLEAGVDLLTISRLLGHRSFSTTLIYLHVRRPHMESVRSPLDLLPLDQCPRFGELPAPPVRPESASSPDPAKEASQDATPPDGSMRPTTQPSSPPPADGPSSP